MRMIAALAMLVLPALFAAQEPPLIPNAGFEEGTDGPAGWVWHTGEDGHAEFEWLDDVARTDTRSFRARKIGSTGCSTVTSDFIPVTPGKTYLVRAWVRPFVQAQRGVYLMVTQHTAESDDQQHPNTFGNTNVPLVAGEWQEITAPPGDAVYASQNFITIHALFPGAKTLTLAAPSRVTDLTSGEVLSERTQTIDIRMQRGETRWFSLEPR